MSYHKLWRSEFYKSVSARDKVQDLKLNRRKLKVKDTSEKDENITTNSEPTANEDVNDKAYIDTKLFKI